MDIDNISTIDTIHSLSESENISHFSDNVSLSTVENNNILKVLQDEFTSKIVSMDKTYEQYYTKLKQTKPFITKFEEAKIIGVRAQMISNGSKVFIDVPKNITKTIDIAELEYKEKKIPLLIRRYLPNNEHEDWRLEELIIK